MRTGSGDRDGPGTALRVPGDGDFEEVLRRALRTAADGVEPAGDALTQIFRRVAAPWRVRQLPLLAAGWADLLWPVAIWLQPVLARAVTVLAAAAGSAHQALRPLTARPRAGAPVFCGRHRRGQARAAVLRGRSAALQARARARAAVARLRPALPVAVTAAVVMTGTVALSQAVARIELSGSRGAGSPALAAAPAAGGQRQSPQTGLTRPGLAQITPARPGTTPARGRGAAPQRSCAATRCPPGPAAAPPPGPATAPPAQPAASPGPTPAPAQSHHHPHPHQPHPHQPHPHPSYRSHPPHPHPVHHSHPPHPGRARTQEAEVRLDAPAVVRTGHTLRHGLLVRNLTGRVLPIATNGNVTAMVVEPQTGQVAGGFAGFQIMLLMVTTGV